MSFNHNRNLFQAGTSSKQNLRFFPQNQPQHWYKRYVTSFILQDGKQGKKKSPSLIPANGWMSLGTRWCSWPWEVMIKLRTCNLGGFHIGALWHLIFFQKSYLKRNKNAFNKTNVWGFLLLAQTAQLPPLPTRIEKTAKKCFALCFCHGFTCLQWFSFVWPGWKATWEVWFGFLLAVFWNCLCFQSSLDC